MSKPSQVSLSSPQSVTQSDAPESHRSGRGPDWSFLYDAGFDDKLGSHWSRMVWRAFSQFIPVAYSGFAPTISLEWFIHRRLHWRWLDRVAPNRFLALFGHEVLVVAEKLPQ